MKIKERFLKRGITNTYLAEKAGIPPGELFGLNKGNRFIRKMLLIRVIQAIKGVSNKENANNI